MMQHRKDDHPTGIVSVGLSTGLGSEGHWELVNFEGMRMKIESSTQMDSHLIFIGFFR